MTGPEKAFSMFNRFKIVIAEIAELVVFVAFVYKETLDALHFLLR
jgi:hypothetical protein